MLALTLPTMTCGHCVQSVTAAVRALDPLAEVHCDLPTHQVQIESQVAPQALREALQAAGYEPADAPA